MNFQRSSTEVPEQPPATFKLKIQAGEEMAWTTQQPFAQNLNPKCAGRRSLKDLSIVSRPTRLARNNCDTLDEPWRLMVTDESLQEVADFTNIKISKRCELMAP